MANKFVAREWPVDQIRQWIADGKTQRWISEQLNCANQTIAKVCKRHGIQCQRTGPRSGPGHPDWKGGRTHDRAGYVLVYLPGHPYAKDGRYVREHRLVMEKHLGRYLLPSEVVHHINGVNDDNRLENLQLFSSNGEHLRQELKGKCPKWSEEGKAAIAKANRDKWTPEMREKMRRMMKERKPAPVSDLTRQRMSDAAKKQVAGRQRDASGRLLPETSVDQNTQ